MTAKNMARQLDMMYRVDSLFRSQPKRYFTLQQVSSMLDVSTRTVERLYDAMRILGAPIETVTKGLANSNGGTNYRQRSDYIFDVGPVKIARIMTNIRLKKEQGKALNEKMKLKRVQSLLKPINPQPYGTDRPY